MKEKQVDTIIHPGQDIGFSGKDAGRINLVTVRVGYQGFPVEAAPESFTFEFFRKQGYSVIENGGGGPDGGVDLRIKKDDKYKKIIN